MHITTFALRSSGLYSVPTNVRDDPTTSQIRIYCASTARFRLMQTFNYGMLVFVNGMTETRASCIYVNVYFDHALAILADLTTLIVPRFSLIPFLPCSSGFHYALTFIESEVRTY